MKKLGLEHRTERLPRRRSQRPEIVELTKQPYVPVLVDGDEVVSDSHRIRQYLDLKYGEDPASAGGIPESGGGVSTIHVDE
jgi:glutathione S-transferase